jgi:hypothetical protein
MKEMRTNYQALMIESVMFLIVLAAVVAAIVHAELKPLSRDDLKVEASDLRSFAASSKQLAEQQVAGQLTQKFFDSQTELLKDKVHSSRSSLDSADVENGLELDHWRVRHLARQLEDALGTANPQREIILLGDLINQLKQEEEALTE